MLNVVATASSVCANSFDAAHPVGQSPDSEVFIHNLVLQLPLECCRLLVRKRTN